MFEHASYLASAMKPEQYPTHNDERLGSLLQFAFFGRSNVGKSSFINRLTRRNSLAFSSKTPGKTATVNFYLVDDLLLLVDLPGYGYARRSASVKGLLTQAIEDYLAQADPICCLLIDFKVGPTPDDVELWRGLVKSGRRSLIIATKRDKVPRSQWARQKALLLARCPVSEDDLYIIANTSDEGFVAIRERFMNEAKRYHGQDTR